MTQQQINLSYDPEQDRLLLKVREVDDSEYRVWLTRRFTALLCKVLQENMARLGGQQHLASNAESVAQMKAGAFSTAYEEPASAALPFGDDGILAYRINYKNEAQDPVALQLLPREGQGINLNLASHTLFMFYNLLEQSLAQTGWQLDETAVPKQLLH